MQAPSDAVKSHRELIRYILQEFQTKGGRLVFPVGCYHLEDWLLDAVHVPKLIQLLQTEREVNLVQACEAPGGSTLLGPPGPLAQGVASTLESPVKLVQANGVPSPRQAAECDLHLPLPRTGLSEEDLQLLSCTLFIGCCTSYCSGTLADDVSRNLQVEQHLTNSLESLLAAAFSQQSQGGTSLEMISILLQIGRPHHFESFEAFTKWRASFAATVSQSLILGAAEASSSERGKHSPSIRKQLLRLKMYSRVIGVPSMEDFDGEIYTEALDMFIGAAGGVAEASRSGWGLPWAIRVRVAELLMASGFDPSDKGQAVAEQEQLVYILRHHLWPILSLPTSLHDLLNAWAYLRQFALTGNAALLSRGKELIDTIRQRRHRGPRSQNLNTVSQEADSDELLDGVMHAAAQWVTGRLARYREFDEAAPVPELVELLVSCQKCLGEQKRVTEILENCIATSIRNEFERAIADLPGGEGGLLKDSNRIIGISACCSEILDEEVACYSPMFSSYVKMPAEIAAIEVHHCFNTYLLPFLQTVHTLEDSNLEAIRSAVGLESKLQTLMGERVAEGLDWAILERLTPLLHLWVANQLSLVQSWYERIFATENWQPVSQPRGCSRSAVELVKIVRETLEALFDLHLGIPEEVVAAAGQGLDAFLQRYAQQTAAQVGSPNFMIPPIPSLTRYKKEVAIKAAAQSKPAQTATPKHQRSSSILSEGPPIGTPEQEHLAQLPITAFTVRMNSLEYIRVQLTALSDIISRRWGVSEKGGPLWAENLFDNTRSAVARSIESIAHFAVTKVIYRDLAEEFASLYVHDVQHSRMGTLLQAVDDKLGSLCSTAEMEVHSLLAQTLLQTTLDAIIRVLLHGGPNRWFKPSDVDLIEEDMEDLRALFHAEGDGLEVVEVQQMCVGVQDLLTVLQLETEILIDNLKQVRQRERMGTASGKQPLAYDNQILLHVLAHREDHAASKYLKKEFALPKKLDSGTMLPGAKSFPTFGRKDSNVSTGGFKKKLSFGNFGRK